MNRDRALSQPRRMPVLFLGHGSPMNAIATNDYTKTLSDLGKKLPRPEAILAISAHWMTRGTWVTHMANPKTIHDFGGFPQALFDIRYPAPGSPALAEKIRALIPEPQILLDDGEWGLDHGTWSLLKHLYPAADIPVVQLSLDLSRSPEFHFELGKKLRSLRDDGVMIIGSGNIVHNLRVISWDEHAKPFAWSVAFDAWVKTCLDQRDFKSLVFDATKTEAGKLSIPTPEHYLPLLYILGAANDDDAITHVIEGIQNASISMRSVQCG